MLFAYADPPYIGVAHRYPEKTEVDHPALIQRLVDEYPDGWALSCHTPSLQYLLGLCPTDVRVMAWVKPWCAWKGVGVAYAWEPVIVRGGRKRTKDLFGDHWRVRDYVKAAVTTKMYFPDGSRAIGAKPEAFCRWLLDVLGYQDGDEIHDLFPGTGILAILAAQTRLAL